jgi:hypothetical protein
MNAYRPDAVVTQSRFATIEDYGTQPVGPDQVDELLQDVAYLLRVRLDPSAPKVRIMVTTPDKIADLYRAGAAAFQRESYAMSLYFPGASLVLVPYFDRELLGHELAHYLTDHYLKQAKRSDWEAIAEGVEDKIGLFHRPVVVAERAAANRDAVVP